MIQIDIIREKERQLVKEGEDRLKKDNKVL